MLCFLVSAELVLQKKDGLDRVAKAYFGEDSDHIVPLTNQKLFDNLAERAASTSSAGTKTDNDKGRDFFSALTYLLEQIF